VGVFVQSTAKDTRKSAPAHAVQDVAIGKLHAAGIVSYAQNQATAWSGDNDNVVRWGHLDSFSPNGTFAFMVSLRTARALQTRLRAGENIQLHARVKAGQHDAFYEAVTAVIEGADPKLKDSGSGAEYAYEALNFADGKHSARQIAAELSAEYGPVPTELVIEYLQALKRIGVVD
jgi:hypothetical protein